MSVLRAMRRIQAITKSSSFRISLAVDWPGQKAQTRLVVPTFILALTTYSRTQGGPWRHWTLWNEGFSPRHAYSTQMGASKAAEEKKRGNESNPLGPEPASRESRSFRDNSGNEYDYWYSRF
jgi:hypothetical protein